MAVTYTIDDGVATITIDRPERRNAVDRATADALGDAWARFDLDEAAAVGVLTGSGGHFSAGADLKAFDLIDRPEGPLGFTRLEVSKPTIAAISGYCVAGGLEMALWCDIRVADEDATLGFFERRWGVPLVDGGTQRLPRIVGLGRASELILTGRAIGAPEAHRIGLVDRLAPPGTSLSAARDLARNIAGFPQDTVRSDLHALRTGVGMPLRDGLQMEGETGWAVIETARRGAAEFAAGGNRQAADRPEPGNS